VLIAVTHTTHFTYDHEIVESTMEAWLEPPTDRDQRRVRFSLTVEPGADLYSYQDGFGNAVHCFSLLAPHRALVLTAHSRVETLLANPFAPPEQPAPDLDPVDAWPYLQFGGAVIATGEVRNLAERFRAERDRRQAALRDLMGHIHHTFAYQPAITSVQSTVADLLELRKGVCQDFAHLMIAVCRAMDVPARYISGYIVSGPDQAARGASASHAWCEAWVPGFGWRGFDPTNDLLAADSHVKVGYGRTYADVPPTRGIYRGQAAESIAVQVSTARLESAAH
jgi:transglutaminase-like putative cysteine protease